MDIGDRRRILFVAANPAVDRMYQVGALQIGAIHRPTSVTSVPGGKGLNAARAAAQLGATVTVVGIVGGRAGDWIVDQLTARGITFQMVESAAETRTCISILDRTSATLTELYEIGSRIGPGDWPSLEARVSEALEQGTVGLVAMSGSLPVGAPEDGYQRIASVAIARGVAVVIDTSPLALRASLSAHPTIVKVNAEEASGASGVHVDGPESAVVASRELRNLGAGAVIVTLGPLGAVLVTPEIQVQLRFPAISGAFSVGSGDAFLGGFATALVAGETLVDSAKKGVAAGAANVVLPGPGQLDLELARRIPDTVVVTSVGNDKTITPLPLDS